MSYLVLARKYRPSVFTEIIGQEHITQTLVGAIESNRLAHAFCFTGPRGVGKTSVARILAKALNCVNGPTTQPCGQCVPCREIIEGRSIDVQEIDAASNRGIDDARELREIIRYRPQSAAFRIIILDEAHMLTREAFNALLKTLEEPPGYTVFILATTDALKVPPTILSRCQRYDFRRLSPSLLVDHLRQVCSLEGFSLPEESLKIIAREADGSTRDALSLLDQLLSYGQTNLTHEKAIELLGLVGRSAVESCTQAIIDGDAGKILDLIDQTYQSGGEMRAFYSYLLEEFRNLAAAKSSRAGVQLFGLTEEEMQSLKTRAEKSSLESLHEAFSVLAAGEEMFFRSRQPRLVMEMTLLKLAQLKPVISLADIISRLETGQLEAKLMEAGINESPAAQPAGSIEKPIQEPALAVFADKKKVESNLRADSKEFDVELSKYIAYVAKSMPALAACLKNADLKFDEQVLICRLSGGPLIESYCNKENEEELTLRAGEFWEEMGKGDKAPVIKLEMQGKKEEINSRPDLHKALEDPAIQEIIEILQADVVDIKPLN